MTGDGGALKPGGHPPPADEDDAVSPGFVVYVVGRPLMLMAWALALWGTIVALRLLWIAATRGPAAASALLGDPIVLVPVVVAALAWVAVAVILALRSPGRR